MIEGLVYTTAKDLFDGRFYPSRFPQAPELPVWPAGRYTVVSQDGDETICGTDTADTDDVRVQIDICALTHGAMIALRDSVIDAFAALTPPPARQGGFQTYDEETKTHRAVLDYLFQQSSD